MEAASINWGATAPPRESADAALFADQWTDGLGVPAGSDQPAEAALFVTFWGTTGGAERLKLGDLSLNLALAEELNWAGDSPGRQEVLEVLQVTGPRLFFPNHGGVLGPIEDAYYTYMLEDRMPAQEALDEAAIFVQEELDQTWETWEQLLSG
jgi:ABC-type glycerol-3-phosphate transport system substrate-binding protein